MESLTARSKQVGFAPCDHEYLNFTGTKLSKSRGTAVEVPYFLSKYDPDPLRFYLTITAPRPATPRPQLRSNCQADAQRQPWFQIKDDSKAAATTGYITQSVRVADNLKTILAPILPHTPVLAHRTQKLHEYRGYEGQPLGSAWGRLFGTQRVIEYEEEARLGGLRSHQRLRYDHGGAVGYTFATISASLDEE